MYMYVQCSHGSVGIKCIKISQGYVTNIPVYSLAFTYFYWRNVISDVLNLMYKLSLHEVYP